MAIQKIYSTEPKYLPDIKPHNVPFGICERIFRAAFYQFMVYTAGWVEQMCIMFYRCGAKKTCCPAPFDDKRMDQSLEAFKQLQVKEHTIYPIDGQAEVSLFVFSPEDLENRINALGGKWEKIDNEFVIIPPIQPTEEWKHFKNACLKTGWIEEERTYKDKLHSVIITSKNADLVTKPNAQCCFRIHDRSVAFQKEVIKFWLGKKQPCAVLNLRGTRQSPGTPSEKGSYLDALAAFEKLLELGFKPEDIWINGSCKSTYIAAIVKKLYHDQGVNFVAEQAEPDLEDMIAHQPWIARKFAEWNRDALKARDISSTIAPEVKEDGYSTSAKWKDLPRTDKGSVVIIYANEDDTLPKGSETRYADLARKVNKHVHTLGFTAPEGLNAHNISCLADKNLQREYARVVFQG